MEIKEDIYYVVRKLVADSLCMSVDQISNDTNIHTDLNVDSLDVIDIVVNIEEEFKISFEEEEIGSITTIEQIVKHIISKTGN